MIYGAEFHHVAKHMLAKARDRAMGRPIAAMVYFRCCWVPIEGGSVEPGRYFAVFAHNDNRRRRA